MKRKVIFDCDNTMGIVGKDVDDGLTLLYLLGREDIELLGLTLTYGNSSLEEVERATANLLRELKIDDLKVFSGDKGGRFLAEEARKHKGEVTVLATGSMSNLHTAHKYDPEFYGNLEEIYLMGGIVEPLIINGVEVNELNFACNHEAAYNVLSSEAKISILNGHVTAKAVFGPEELEELYKREGRVYRFIEDSIGHWVERINKKFGIEGFCNWDMAAAIYMSHKELFTQDEAVITPDRESLKRGDLNLDKEGVKRIVMPREILDMKRFNSLIFEAFESFQNKYEV